jgi:uncharacterized protein
MADRDHTPLLIGPRREVTPSPPSDFDGDRDDYPVRAVIPIGWRMGLSSPRLRRLDGALYSLSDEGMLLSELDGYLTGVILSPDPIEPVEWLPPIWGGDAAPFDDERDTAWFIALVTEHRDAIARALARGRFAPIIDVDPRHDEILWEIWIDGFATAMKLRPDSWVKMMADADDEGREAVAGMITLAEIASDESDLERDRIDELTEAAPGLIVPWIERLHAQRTRDGVEPLTAAPTSAAKIGRNDPCPCGSGRKYKKCCAAG